MTVTQETSTFNKDEFANCDIQSSYLKTLKFIAWCRNKALMYCGHHSHFIIYPSFAKLSVMTTTHRFTYFHWKASFVVMDYLFTTDPTYHTTNYQFTKIHYPKKKRLVMTYFFHTKKIHQVLLQLSSKIAHAVYDGPGLLSDKLRFTQDLCLCSTFQCILQMNMRSTKLSKITRTLSYKAKIVSFSVRMQIYKDTDLKIPEFYCITRPCAMSFRAGKDAQVNVSVSQLDYQGLEDPACRYGGLSAVEYLNKDIKEGITLCKNDFQRNIYPHTLTLFLILFWYKAYSTITVKLAVSPTPCKLVQINVCTFDRCAIEQTETFFVAKSPHCKTYLNDIAKFANVQIKGIFQKVVLTLLHQKCFVLQSVRMETNFTDLQRYSVHSCQLEVMLETIYEPNTEIKTQISGSLESFQSHRIFVPEYAAMHKRVRTSTGNQIQERENFQQKCLHQPFNQFLVEKKITTPFVRQTILQIELSRGTKSWFDLTVYWQELPEMTKISLQIFPSYLSEHIAVTDTNYVMKTLGTHQEDVLCLQSNLTRNTLVNVFISTNSTKNVLLHFYFASLVKSSQQYFSLPGSVHEVVFKVSDRNDRNNVSILASWIHNNYKTFAPYLNKEPTTTISGSIFRPNSKTKSNFSSFVLPEDVKYYVFHKTEFYYLDKPTRSRRFRPSYPESKFMMGHQRRLMTWDRSSQLCTKYGGHLPWFISRDESQGLVALLKLSEEISPLEALYIGLKFNSTKVTSQQQTTTH